MSVICHLWFCSQLFVTSHPVDFLNISQLTREYLTDSMEVTNFHDRHRILQKKLTTELKHWFDLGEKVQKKDHMTPTPVWFCPSPTPLFFQAVSDARQHVRENGDDIPTRANCHARHLDWGARRHEVVWKEIRAKICEHVTKKQTSILRFRCKQTCWIVIIR